MCIIAVGNDHTAFPIRKEIIGFLENELSCQVIDMGTDSEDSTDYPIYARKVGLEVLKGKADMGVLICGTGVGVSMAANKIQGVRCAVCYSVEVARMARRHNNANILAFGARTQKVELIKQCLRAFLEETFEKGRHERRINLIRQIEQEQEESDGGY